MYIHFLLLSLSALPRPDAARGDGGGGGGVAGALRGGRGGRPVFKCE